MLPAHQTNTPDVLGDLGDFKLNILHSSKTFGINIVLLLDWAVCRYWSDKYYFRVMITRANPTTCLIELWWYKFIHIFFFCTVQNSLHCKNQKVLKLSRAFGIIIVLKLNWLQKLIQFQIVIWINNCILIISNMCDVPW